MNASEFESAIKNLSMITDIIGIEADSDKIIFKAENSSNDAEYCYDKNDNNQAKSGWLANKYR